LGFHPSLLGRDRRDSKWEDDEVARKEKRSKRGDTIATTQIAKGKKGEEGESRKKKGKRRRRASEKTRSRSVLLPRR